MRCTNESQSSPTADGPCMRQGLNCRELSALHPRAENYAPEMRGAWEVINPKCNSEFPDRWEGEERAAIREDGTETFRCRVTVKWIRGSTSRCGPRRCRWPRAAHPGMGRSESGSSKWRQKHRHRGSSRVYNRVSSPCSWPIRPGSFLLRGPADDRQP